MKRFPTVISSLFAAAALAVAALPASAQTWPAKPITLVVTYAAGGGADAMARLLAPRLSQELGQPVVVDNRPGGSGQIGAAQVARSAPDGYTLMFDASSYAVNPALFPKLPYDTEQAFKPIGIVALFPNVILVTPGFPAKTVAELVGAAKAGRDAVSYASSGNGSAQHLAGALFESLDRRRDAARAVQGRRPGAQRRARRPGAGAVRQHRLDAAAHPRRQAARARRHRRASARRCCPRCRPLAEAGVKGYEVYEWNVLAAPARTPEAVVARLSEALRKALATAEVKSRIDALGGEIVGGTPQAAERFVREQTAAWTKVIRERRISVE